MPDSTRLAFIDDETLLSKRAAVRQALEHEPARKAELTRVYDALTAEFDRRATQTWTENFEPREPGKLHRTSAEMSTWELIATYRHAWALAYYRPARPLAKQLANWLLTTRRELESRDAWVPEIMPPHSM